MTAPDRIYINKVHGQHPEDWDFTDGKYLTKKQLAAKVEYIRADLAAALQAERDDAVIKRAAWELEAKTLQSRLTAAEAREERLRGALREIADRPDYRLPKPQDIARAALTTEARHD